MAQAKKRSSQEFFAASSKHFTISQQRGHGTQSSTSGRKGSKEGKPNEDLAQMLSMPKNVGIKQKANRTRVHPKPLPIREAYESNSTSHAVPFTETTTKDRGAMGGTAVQLSMFGASTGRMEGSGLPGTPGETGMMKIEERNTNT